MPAFALDLTARVTLAPIILGQALYAAKTSPKLPEPTGPRRGVIGAGPPLRLLVLGDSSAAGVGVAHQNDALLGQTLAALAPEFEVHYQLHAKTGATTADTLQRLAALPDQCFDAVIIGLGVNDVTSGLRRSTWITQTKALLATLTTRFHAKHICLTGLPPVSRFPLLPQPLRWVVGRQAERYDRASRRIAARHAHVDRITFDLTLRPDMMARDGYHPGPQIYTRWAHLCAARIAAHWDRDCRWMSAG
jgi:lysophospholipase L1-like esterase